MITDNQDVVNQLQDIVKDLDNEIANYKCALKKNEEMFEVAKAKKDVTEAAMFIGSKEIIKLAIDCTTNLRVRYNERLTMFTRKLPSFIVQINERPDRITTSDQAFDVFWRCSVLGDVPFRCRRLDHSLLVPRFDNDCVLVPLALVFILVSPVVEEFLVWREERVGGHPCAGHQPDESCKDQEPKTDVGKNVV